MRRKTFLLNLTKGTAFPRPIEFEVLALDAQHAVDWCNRNGWTVHGVPRLKPRRKLQRWTLDTAALDEVVAFFGLEYPVWITKSDTSRTHGWHQFTPSWRLPQSAPAHLRRRDAVHRINVCSTDSPAQASRTIWHELCHAMQAERVMAATPGNVMSKNRAWVDEANRDERLGKKSPLEREACSWEAHAVEIAPAV